MRTDLWGSCKGILIVCFLLSKFEQRSLNAAASSCGRGYFFIRIKKDAFSKISGYVWTGPKCDLESSAQLTSEAFCQVAQKVPRPQQSKSHASKLGKLAMLLTKYSCVAV